MDWEEVVYTIMFLTALVMILLGVIPISLMITDLKATPDSALIWELFIKVEAVGVMILTLTQGIIRAKKAAEARKEDSW